MKPMPELVLVFGNEDSKSKHLPLPTEPMNDPPYWQISCNRIVRIARRSECPSRPSQLRCGDIECFMDLGNGLSSARTECLFPAINSHHREKSPGAGPGLCSTDFGLVLLDYYPPLRHLLPRAATGGACAVPEPGT